MENRPAFEMCLRGRFFHEFAAYCPNGGKQWRRYSPRTILSLVWESKPQGEQ
jgi:hypothetical protein